MEVLNKLPLKNWDEEDFLNKSRQFYFAQRGEIRKVKRRYSKRVRRWWKQEIFNQVNDMYEGNN